MKRYLLAVMMLAGLSAAAFAQSFTGTVSGRVLDPNQAVVSKASMSLKNAATGAERRTVTDDQGDYSFNAVAPGQYTLIVEASGFERRETKVEVSVATSLRADVTLALKGQQIEVTVNATGEGGIAVQTEQATIGNTISNRQVTELPTLTRNPL